MGMTQYSFENNTQENKNGRDQEWIWCVYKGKEYWSRVLDDGMIELWSSDKKELKSGFTVLRNDRDGFICAKKIKKQDVEKAFEYKTYAMYKDLKCEIGGSFKTGFRLDTCDWVDVRIYNELLEKVGIRF